MNNLENNKEKNEVNSKVTIESVIDISLLDDSFYLAYIIK